MADYFTKFSFVIPVTPEQGEWLMQAHELASAIIGNIEDGERGESAERPADLVSAALVLAEGRDGFPCLEVSHDAREGAVWVRSEDSGDVDYAADLTQAFLRRFELNLVVAFQWANTCSKPRLDAFGGGAAVVSRRNIDWFSTTTLVTVALQTETRRLTMKPEADLDGIDLAGTVFRVSNSLAADANTDGVGAQLDFLLEHGWLPPEDLLREADLLT